MSQRSFASFHCKLTRVKDVWTRDLPLPQRPTIDRQGLPNCVEEEGEKLRDYPTCLRIVEMLEQD